MPWEHAIGMPEHTVEACQVGHRSHSKCHANEHFLIHFSLPSVVPQMGVAASCIHRGLANCHATADVSARRPVICERLC